MHFTVIKDAGCGEQLGCMGVYCVVFSYMLYIRYGWKVGNGRKPQGALSKFLYTAIIYVLYSCRVESAASFHDLVNEEGSSILPLKALKGQYNEPRQSFYELNLSNLWEYSRS